MSRLSSQTNSLDPTSLPRLSADLKAWEYGLTKDTHQRYRRPEYDAPNCHHLARDNTSAEHDCKYPHERDAAADQGKPC